MSFMKVKESGINSVNSQLATYGCSRSGTRSRYRLNGAKVDHMFIFFAHYGFSLSPTSETAP